MSDKLTDTSKLLFTLLRSALWGGTPISGIAANQFQQVMSFADKQTVAGLVFDVLKNKQIDGMEDKMPIYEAIGLTEQIKQQNVEINKELVWFIDKCQEVGLECLVVKGQTLAALYPNPKLRQSGDIDFLITQIAQVPQVFPNVGFPERMSEKEFAFNHNDITYELHCRLIDFGCKNHQKLWGEMEAKELSQRYTVNVDVIEVRTLSPTMNAAYLFVHLFFHLIREGVSLRQFCDWAMVLHHYHGEIDSDKLIIILQDLELFDAFCAFGVILIDCLRLPKNEFPFALDDDDRKWKKKILQDIFRGGNFGKQNHKATTAFGYKFETMCLAIRNSIRYYKLAPSEMRMMIPKMIGINLKLLFN